VKLKAIARKFRLDEIPDERMRWQALPLEERLRAVVEMTAFWATLKGQNPSTKIAPVARKRPLGKA